MMLLITKVEDSFVLKFKEVLTLQTGSRTLVYALCLELLPENIQIPLCSNLQTTLSEFCMPINNTTAIVWFYNQIKSPLTQAVKDSISNQLPCH